MVPTALGDHLLPPWQSCNGVLHGTILFTLLFNSSIKPLEVIIGSFGVTCHQLHFSVTAEFREAVDWGLDYAVGLMRANTWTLDSESW